MMELDLPSCGSCDVLDSNGESSIAVEDDSAVAGGIREGLEFWPKVSPKDMCRGERAMKPSDTVDS